MSTCAVELRTADVALTLANSVLGNLIVVGQAPALLWDGELRAYCHAAPILSLDHELWLPHLSRAIRPGVYTLDATLAGLVPTSLPAQVIAGEQIRIRRIPAIVRAQVSPFVIQERIESWAAERCGKVQYSLSGLFGFLPRFLWGNLPAEALSAALATVCSEETSLAVREAVRSVEDPETGWPYDPVPWRACKWTAPTHLGSRAARLENLRDIEGDTIWCLEPKHVAS